MLVTIALVLLLAALAVALIMGLRGRSFGSLSGRQRSQAGGYAEGVLTVTGVSERREPDSKGQSFCTISGTIVGPGTDPTDVYASMVWPQEQQWPQMGSDLPVTYKPGKVVSTWQFGGLPPVA